MNKFKVSFEGILYALKDKSIQIQCILAVMAIVAAIVLKFTQMEWIVFILCIGMVIAAEMFNTCIERICDLVHPEIDERIKRIKDMSSGAVLVVCLMSLVIAMLIGWNHL